MGAPEKPSGLDRVLDEQWETEKARMSPEEFELWANDFAIFRSWEFPKRARKDDPA